VVLGSSLNCLPKILSKVPSPTALIKNFATISRTRDSAQFNTKFPIAYTNTLTCNHAKKLPQRLTIK
jgi:hypothetical protein